MRRYKKNPDLISTLLPIAGLGVAAYFLFFRKPDRETVYVREAIQAGEPPFEILKSSLNRWMQKNRDPRTWGGKNKYSAEFPFAVTREDTQTLAQVLGIPFPFYIHVSPVSEGKWSFSIKRTAFGAPTQA